MMASLVQMTSTCFQTFACRFASRSSAGAVLRLTEIRKLHSIHARSDDNRRRNCGDSFHHRRTNIICHQAFGRKMCLEDLAPVHVPRRNFSIETYNKYFSPDVPPIGFAQKVLEAIHTTTGLPWWASIAASTLMLRGVVTLPLAVYSMHIMARVELLQPEIAKLSQELRREVAVAVKKFAWDAKYTRFKYNSTMKKLIKDLYIRDNCHPAKSSLVLWFQIPMWVCLSFALRNMSGAVPTAVPGTDSAVLCPDLKTEGVLWFPDMTAPDSTWLLPLMLGLTNLLNIEMHSLTAQRVSRFQKSLVLVMRVLSLAMIPIGSVVPSCMCYYWMCSSVFGLGQTILFKAPSLRRLLRVPKTPSESQTPFTDLYNAARLKYTIRPKQKET
ncbi:cytochrome c oxidase assembly protein COX18, mitochondrial-like [Babylonia areolata]|uniref:cytochrome c oxidase assembly protein COX18, mitochondrial-like n=1 Tax=Babylonia areolata TaxID=304850 RepID=UPI003FD5C1D7